MVGTKMSSVGLENILLDSLLKPHSCPTFGLQEMVQSTEAIILQSGLAIMAFPHSSVQLRMLLVSPPWLLFVFLCPTLSSSELRRNDPTVLCLLVWGLFCLLLPSGSPPPPS